MGEDNQEDNEDKTNLILPLVNFFDHHLLSLLLGLCSQFLMIFAISHYERGLFNNLLGLGYWQCKEGRLTNRTSYFRIWCISCGCPIQMLSCTLGRLIFVVQNYIIEVYLLRSWMQLYAERSNHVKFLMRFFSSLYIVVCMLLLPVPNKWYRSWLEPNKQYQS